MAAIWSWFVGATGKWTFIGYLLCTGPNPLGGCLPNHTHFVTYSNLSESRCLLYQQEARSIPGASGGFCSQQR